MGALLDLARYLAALAARSEVLPRTLGSICTVEARGDFPRQLELRFHRVAPFRDLAPQLRDLRSAAKRQEIEVAPHELIRDRPELAEHVIRWLGDTHVVAEGLGHLVDAIQPFQQRHREHDLRLLTVGLLQLPTD